MTKPSFTPHLLAGAAVLALLATTVSAQADFIEKTTTACKARSTAARLDRLLAGKDMRSYRRLVVAKTRRGECRPIRAHTHIKVEKNEGDLACVKAKGDRRCVWVLELAVRITSERHEPVRRAYFACKSPLYLDTLHKIMARHDRAAMKRFRFVTRQSGQCLRLRRGERVDVEKRKDNILCVRPRREHRCYWTDKWVLPPRA